MGGTPASCGLLWLGRTTMWKNYGDKQGRWIDRQVKSKRWMKGNVEGRMRERTSVEQRARKVGDVCFILFF